MSTGVESLDLFDGLSNPPGVIVVSSTGMYARTAFDHNVVDYLIKPLDYSRFTRLLTDPSGFSSINLLPVTRTGRYSLRKNRSCEVKNDRYSVYRST
jgi:DNA-binding LytR/AlgR family response regulator